MPLDESKFDDDDNACSPRRPSTQKQEHNRRSKSKRTETVKAQGEEKSCDGDDADLSPDGLTSAEEDLFSSYTNFCASDKFMSKYLKIIVEWSFKFASSRLGDGKERRQYSHEMREIFDSYVEEYERHLEFFLEREGSSPASFFRILKRKKTSRSWQDRNMVDMTLASADFQTFKRILSTEDKTHACERSLRRILGDDDFLRWKERVSKGLARGTVAELRRDCDLSTSSSSSSSSSKRKSEEGKGATKARSEKGEKEKKAKRRRKVGVSHPHRRVRSISTTELYAEESGILSMDSISESSSSSSSSGGGDDSSRNSRTNSVANLDIAEVGTAVGGGRRGKK